MLGGIALACGGLGLALGHKRVWAAIAAGGVVLGVVAELHGILANAEKPKAPTKTAPAK
ncbi:MAG: hypothetical protein ABR583_03220 [Gaiellaceae bacterium]